MFAVVRSNADVSGCSRLRFRKEDRGDDRRGRSCEDRKVPLVETTMASLRLEKSLFSPFSPHAAGELEIYQVIGVPPGHEVFIRRTDGTWKVMRAKNGVRRSWDEGYPTLDDAFAAVRFECDLAEKSIDA